MNNNAPFYVGQRVVALETNYYWKEGDEFIVKDVKKICCYWGVDVGIITDKRVSCEYCNTIHSTGRPYFIYNIFAPVQEQYADCREELASKVEVGDTADQPVRVLSN